MSIQEKAMMLAGGVTAIVMVFGPRACEAVKIANPASQVGAGDLNAGKRFGGTGLSPEDDPSKVHTRLAEPPDQTSQKLGKPVKPDVVDSANQ